MGDIIDVENGKIIPVDGVLLQGHGVEVSEASLTGESDALKKNTYENAMSD